MGVLNLGTVGLDDTNVHAHASRPDALAYGQAQKIEMHAGVRTRNARNM